MKTVYKCIMLCLITSIFICQQVECDTVYCEDREWLGQGIIYGRYQKQAQMPISEAANGEGTDNDEYRQLRNMKQLNILPALEKYQGNLPVVVAVLDTGIDYQHEDLFQNIWKNEREIPGNGIDDDGNGYVDDVYGWDFFNNDNTISYLDEKDLNQKNQNNESTEDAQSADNHGTHCAGLIAARAGNGIGTAGIAGQGNVKIMIVKVFDKNKGKTSVKKLISAIRYATAMGADIINASWSGMVNSEKEANLLKEAIIESGKLFITAAGNYGESNDNEVTYPAHFGDLDNVVVVGSVKEDGTLSEFSDYGQSVHVAADGENIYSTFAGSKYGYSSGTSMSTAIVTGMASLVYSTKHSVYPKAVKQLLLQSCNPIATKEDGKDIAAGIIDAEQVVENIDYLLTDEKTPVVHEVQTNYNGDVAFSVLEQGGARLCSMNYAKGAKKSAYFLHGMRGTKLKKEKFRVNSSGKYTIFLRDYAGNESVKVIEVVVDRKTPVITAEQNNKVITVKVTDKETAVTKVKYAYKKRTLNYFKSGKGKMVILKNNKVKLKYNKNEKYITIYAEDQAGNKRVTPFVLKGKRGN